MAKKKKTTKLSAGELRLMSVLWEAGPLTLAETHQRQRGQLGYTTIQTQLNRLVEKGVASRSKSRPMKYRALVDPREAGATLLQLLIDTVGAGSIVPLVGQLIQQVELSKEDVWQLKQFINQATGVLKKKKKQTR